MRNQHPPQAVEINLCFKPEAEAVSLAEIDLLISIWPEILRAIQLEEGLAQPDKDADLE